MRSGRLRHRVEILSRSHAPTRMGGQGGEWTRARECWAEIEPMSGREIEIAAGMNSRAQVRITMRAWEGLTAAMRIRWIAKGRNYSIADVRDIRHVGREMQVYGTYLPEG